MSVNVKLKCSFCNHLEERVVEIPFNCDILSCTNCHKPNTFSIVSAKQCNVPKNLYDDSLEKLFKLRLL